MDISLSQILNEIVEEIVENKKIISEGVDPEAVTATNPDEVPVDGAAEPIANEDDDLLAKLASAFTPEEANELVRRLESGEISEDDILAHLESLNQAPVSESIQEGALTPSVISALASGAGALSLRKHMRFINN